MHIGIDELTARKPKLFSEGYVGISEAVDWHYSIPRLGPEYRTRRNGEDLNFAGIELNLQRQGQR